MPISELRGGIPYALANDIHPLVAYFLCVGANAMAFPITMFFLEFLHPIFCKVNIYQKLFDKFVVRTRNKLEKSIDRWGFWGLMIFVMIPLPVTGAYTGSFGAWLFNIKKKQSFLAITLGVVIAGIIVSVVYLFFRESLGWLFKEVGH